MESQRLCVYNQTRRSSLGIDVIAGEFSHSSLNDWMSRLTPDSGAALWLVPFRGISAARASVPIDLVFLDADCRVIEVIEFFPKSCLSDAVPPAASVLALPVHMIHSSQTRKGDQLIVCPAEEIASYQGRLYDVGAASPIVGALPGPILLRKETSSGIGSPLTPSENRSEGVQLSESQQSEDTAPTKASAADSQSRGGRLVRWLLLGQADKTKDHREPATGLVAFFWTGGVPEAHVIRDVSSSGLYLITSERWYLGTVVRLTLRIANGNGPGHSICIRAEATGWGNDGVDLRFVPRDARKQTGDLAEHPDGADRKQLELFLARWRTVVAAGGSANAGHPWPQFGEIGRPKTQSTSKMIDSMS